MWYCSYGDRVKLSKPLGVLGDSGLIGIANRLLSELKYLLRFCAGTCSAIPDQARLANLGYLSMR